MDKSTNKYSFNTSEKIFSNVLKPATLEEVALTIKSDKGLKSQSEKVRDSYRTDMYSKNKLLLPVALFAGIFIKRKKDGLQQLSGLICLDLDKLDDLGEAKEKLLQLDFVAMMFTSPSGVGLKPIIKINVNSVEEFSQYFNALENYFSKELQLEVDTACKDVSRACLLCHDKDVYYNENSKVLTKNFIEKWGVKEVVKKQLKSVSKTEVKSENWLMNLSESEKRENASYAITSVQQKIKKADDGEKHNVLLSQSNYLGFYVFYGILSIEKAKEVLLKAISKRKVKSLSDAEKTIDSGLKHAINKPVDAEDLGLYNNRFWTIIKDSSGRVNISIRYTKLYKFLSRSGYWIYKKDDTYLFVKIKDNIIYKIDKHHMINFVLNYIKQLPFEIQENVYRDSLEEVFRMKMNVLFSENQRHTIELLKPNFVRDTKDEGFFFYKNGVLKISVNEKLLIPYKDIDGHIWETQILNRNYVNTELTLEDLSIKSEIGRFLQGVSGKLENGSHKRLHSLHSVVGYQLHSYKDPKLSKAIIFCDEAVSENPSGGVGKSLIVKAISYFKNIATIDGKNVKFSSQFVFQRVELDTKLIVFEDVEKKFPFEKLFSVITEGIGVEKKNKDKFYINYMDSPKVVLTTNYMIDGQGNSHERRRLEYECSQHYNKHHTPYDEFGHSLFDDWTTDEWVLFDNFMISCCQFFLKNGLVNPPKINIGHRKVIQATCEDFAVFMDQKIKEIVNKEIDKVVIKNEFLNRYEEYRHYNWFSSRLFYKWLRTYGEYHDFKITERVSNNVQLIRFTQ